MPCLYCAIFDERCFIIDCYLLLTFKILGETLIEVVRREPRVNNSGHNKVHAYVNLLGCLAEFQAEKDVTTTDAVITIISAEIWFVFWKSLS